MFRIHGSKPIIFSDFQNISADLKGPKVKYKPHYGRWPRLHMTKDKPKLELEKNIGTLLRIYGGHTCKTTVSHLFTFVEEREAASSESKQQNSLPLPP